MPVYRIRPHHLLCLSFFEGKGYSPAFVQNTSEILARLNQNATVDLTEGMDDICAACPHNQQGICESQDKVLRYDTAVLDELGLTPGERVSWNRLHEDTFYRLIQNGRFTALCGDCEWADLCTALAGVGGRSPVVEH